MKVYTTGEIRNIALAGNAGSGKTGIAEAMLFTAGKLKRMGTIEANNTVSDFKPVEHEQESSVFSAVMHAEWDGVKINILDSPGALDFISGAVNAISVSDTTLLLVNTQNSIEVGTELHWRLTEKFDKPVVLIANHLDHDQSNFNKTVEDAKEKFSGKAVVVQYPVNPGPEFNAVVDVLAMKMYTWKDGADKPEVEDIPADQADQAEEMRMELIEAAAESDDELMEVFFENETLNDEELKKGLLQGILKRNLFPIFCTDGKHNKGMARLMDFIKDALPAPNDVEPPKTTDDQTVEIKEDGPTSLFGFKIAHEEHLGEVFYFKMISGALSEGQDLINANNLSKERISQIYHINGKEKVSVNKIVAGDIGATVKLKSTKGEHTLNEKGTEYKFPGIDYPNPKFRIAVKAESESDEEKMGEHLHKLRDEDPTYILEYSKELKQLIVHGQGEHHLNTLRWHLQTLNKIKVEFIPPRIPYRETITKPAQADYRHKKQSGGAGQFGEVHMIIDPYEEGKADPDSYKIDGKEYSLSIRDKEEIPLDWGGKLVFHNCIVGGVIDKNYMPAIIKGLMEKMEDGPLTGSYARDIRVFVYDGKMHDVDSNEVSFKIAGSRAFSDAFKKAKPKILEPIYNLEVMVPGDRMGDVMSDLQGRRAIIQGMSSVKGFEVISAKVPLAEITKYATALSSLTGGRATYEMEFDEYAPVPGDLQEELIKKHEEAQAGDE